MASHAKRLGIDLKLSHTTTHELGTEMKRLQNFAYPGIELIDKKEMVIDILSKTIEMEHWRDTC